MKILIIGCGSIGLRHAQNFNAFAEVFVCDADAGKLKTVPQDCTTYSSIDEALAQQNYDGIVIALPTAFHFDVGLKALKTGAYVLVEKPLCLQLEEAEELVKIGGEKLYVVSNMRYHQAINALRIGLDRIGQPLFARAQFGNYLPNMRSGVDYTQLYVAQRKSGGGVVMDCIHELDYLQHFFGAVVSVGASLAKVSDLDIEAEDYASLSLVHENGMRSELHLDYVQQIKQRGCEIIGSAGSVIWRSIGKAPEHCQVTLYVDGEAEILLDTTALDGNQCYVDMADDFCNIIGGGQGVRLAHAAEGLGALKLVHAAYRASEKGQVIHEF